MLAVLIKYSLYMNANRQSSPFGGNQTLFDFAFAENHMLTRPRIIFFQFKLFRLGAWVLFGHVKIASVGCAYKFDLKGRWLSHDTNSLIPCDQYKLNWQLSLKSFAESAVNFSKCQACISVFLSCLIVAFLPFFAMQMMMTAGAVPRGFVRRFCQFFLRQPILLKCRQK